MSHSPEEFLRQIPPVNDILQHPEVKALLQELGRPVIVDWARTELEQLRHSSRSLPNRPKRAALTDSVVHNILRRAEAIERSRIGPVINATGVILHTGLGRSCLSRAAKAALVELGGAGNVEVDLATGERRYRGHQLTAAFQALTGAQDALIVNNNAAATLLTLQALCASREVVLSRGQLIEIGGSFRLPDVFRLSGAVLREVGTTNRTHLSDYRKAIGPETAAVMHVHPSNYSVVGFTTAPEIEKLAALAHEHQITAIDDIGSGALIDMAQFGLPSEPTFADSLAGGADLVLGSGDKLLGGPQCGVILGRSDLVERVRRHPLARAVRVGKLTLAALSATLDAYLRGVAQDEIPTLARLTAAQNTLQHRCEQILESVGTGDHLHLKILADQSPVGGGSLPGAELPTVVLSLTHSKYSAEELARRLRLGAIRVFPRVQHDRVLIDLRSVDPDDDSRIGLAIRLLVGRDVSPRTPPACG